MGKFFAGEFFGAPFRLFSLSHNLALLIILLCILLIYRFKDSLRREKVNKIIRYTLASLIILQELSLSIWRVATEQWVIQTSLPLHLCGLSLILSAVMLVKKDYNLFEVIYFWGLAGATQALMTPDIANYSFPHYRFFQFFLSHALIIISVLFMVFVEKFRPKFKSIWKTLIATNIYLILIAGFNLLTNANYLFICGKPDTPSILDFLGDWPWYVLVMEVFGVISFLICYLPYAINDLIRKYKFAFSKSPKTYDN